MSDRDAVAHVLRYISKWSVFSHAGGTYCVPFRAAADTRADARVRYWNNLIERIYGEFDLPVGAWWDKAAQRVVHGAGRRANVTRPTHKRKRAGVVPAKRSVVRVDSKRARSSMGDLDDAGIDDLIDALLARKVMSSEGGVKVDAAELKTKDDATANPPALEFEGGFPPDLEASDVPFVSA